MFTVFGASGFIGSHLMRHLESSGSVCTAVVRGDDSVWERDLGHVIFCIGMTADFRSRPLDTVDAHVGALLPLLRRGRFDSLLYLSSTRVYSGATSTREDAELRVSPGDASDLYNLTKLVGESACLTTDQPSVRVVRLSNVYGLDLESENFLASIIRDALDSGEVRLASAVSSAKDYVAIEDVVRGLVAIAEKGRERIYNLASGENTTHAAILDVVSRVTGCRVEIEPGAPATRFPPIDVGRMRGEFDLRPARLVDRLEDLVAAYRSARA